MCQICLPSLRYVPSGVRSCILVWEMVVAATMWSYIFFLVQSSSQQTSAKESKTIGDATSIVALQQQQCYEREAPRAEIDYSKKLLKTLREYKGEDLEVIREPTAFARETVEENNDLLLPPYSSWPSRSLVSDDGFPSRFPSTYKLSQNGVTSKSESKTSLKGVRQFFSAAAKAVLTLVGVITVLKLAGFEPMLISKRKSELKVLGLFQQQMNEEKGAMVQCPPGKVLVVEDGEAQCLVKERVEIPFESVVATPDVNYGRG